MPKFDRPVILVTGFDPFDGAAINPSWELAKAVQGQSVADATVVSVQLPTVFGDSLNALATALQVHRPQMVVCLGLAGGRSAMSIERVAINVNDARIPDNAGQQPIDEQIAPNGPAAYFSTLPIKAMRRAMEEVGCPAEISQTAGTFVCNQTMYGVLHQAQALWEAKVIALPIRAGFIHVPWLDGEGSPSLSLECMQRGLMAALNAAWHTQRDERLGGGATH